jgi:hypothetical protein
MATTEVYPVININEKAQTVEQAGLAFENEAAGVYLINHHNNGLHNQIDAYNAVAQQYPDKFIGLNIVYLPTSFETFNFVRNIANSGYIARLPDAIWFDDAGQGAEITHEIRQEDPDLAAIKYLGGIAFKYKNFFSKNSARAVKEVYRLSQYVDVVAANSDDMGVPLSLDKVQSLKQAAAGKPIAIDGGITSDNMPSFNGNVDQILASESIETFPQSGIIDPFKIAKIIRVAKSISIQENY